MKLHAPTGPSTEADASSALDRIDRLLDRIDAASTRALARLTQKDRPSDDD